MWPELMGAAAAWVAHASWYLADPGRRTRLAPSARPRPWLSGAARIAAIAFTLLAGLFWVRAHGAALGLCCLLGGLTAAASVNTIVAPLSPRALLVMTASSAALLLLGGMEVLVGA